MALKKRRVETGVQAGEQRAKLSPWLTLVVVDAVASEE
jgi:hypothetical protein